VSVLCLRKVKDQANFLLPFFNFKNFFIHSWTTFGIPRDKKRHRKKALSLSPETKTEIILPWSEVQGNKFSLLIRPPGIRLKKKLLNF
jgi:hypothetical protein